MNNRRLITERERPLTASGFRVMKGEREFITYQRDANIRAVSYTHLTLPTTERV